MWLGVHWGEIGNQDRSLGHIIRVIAETDLYLPLDPIRLEDEPEDWSRLEWSRRANGLARVGAEIEQRQPEFIYRSQKLPALPVGVPQEGEYLVGYVTMELGIVAHQRTWST